jgi:hypothetical protein
MIADADPSQMFILAPDAPILANLAALWESDPKLARAIEALEDPTAYPIEKSKSGMPTLAMKTADGRNVYLHSRHQPIEEARRMLEGIDAQEKMTFYVIGLGLGYHLEMLFERASDEAIFCVFEPDLRMIRTALEHRDFSKLFRSHRVMWFYKGEKSEIFQRLTPHTALVSMGTETIIHFPSRQLHESFFRQTEISLLEFAAFTRTNMNTLVLNSRKTAENIAKNIGWYAATPSLARLRERYKSRPAVIVSAGPSLRKNKHLLAGLDQNAVIIAVQTTLQPLLEMGVQPQFVTSLDYHEICTRFFEKLPPGLRTELIAEPKATCAIFNMMTGPVNVIGNEFAEGLIREMKLDKPVMTSGATVAHLAFYFAEFLGCDPIIFVGQDLGFSDGLCYAPGTSYEDVWRPELSRFCTVEMKQWEQIVRDRQILRQIPDYQGRPMYTEERLYTYLHQFERDFGKSKAKIIDCTEGGAAKRGAIAMPLKEAISKYCGQPLLKIVDEAAPLRWDLLDPCIESILRRKDEAIEIEKISRDVLPLLEDILANISDQARVNRTIARIDELRKRMDALGQTYVQITQFTQQSELTRFERDRRLAAQRIDGIDRQKRQVERDIDNVKAMITASQDYARLMDEVAGQLKRQSHQRKEAA